MVSLILSNISRFRFTLPFLVQKDAAFCAYCIAFGQPTSGDVFAEKGFKDWKNATGMKRGMLMSHNESKGHQDAC
jgi:hypothetical protein